MNLIQDVLRAAESKPEQDRFVRVKLEDILPDPENFYNTDEIEELAAAIDAFGLEQPLVVRPADDEPGKYRLTGGHRRRLALLTLYAKDPDRWREVDARLTTSLGALADQARLILMNRTARKETEYENMMETVKTAEIAREFKAGGGKVEGKTRAAVAAALGISSAQAGKYQAIYKHLCPTLMQRYKAGVIGTQVAYELSSLPKRQQEEIAATYPVPTLEAVRKKIESAPETFPDWALPMAKEFVNKKWVRKLEHFSAAALQALATNTGGTNNCGGITDTSAKGIRFYMDGQRVQYTWAQFVKACAGAGVVPEPMARETPKQTANAQPTPPPAEQSAPPVQTQPTEPPAVAVSPAPVSEPPAAEPTAQDTDADTDALADAAHDLSNYCEQNGSGEFCKGCYFYDDVRGACRIGLPFTWEV